MSLFVTRARWLDPTTVLVLSMPSREFIRNQDDDGGIPPPSSSPASLSHDTRAPTTPVGTHTLTNHGHARRARWRGFLDSTLDVEGSHAVTVLLPLLYTYEYHLQRSSLFFVKEILHVEYVLEHGKTPLRVECKLWT